MGKGVYYCQQLLLVEYVLLWLFVMYLVSLLLLLSYILYYILGYYRIIIVWYGYIVPNYIL